MMGKPSLEQRIARSYIKLSVLGSRIAFVAAIEVVLIATAIVVALAIRLERFPNIHAVIAGVVLLIPIRLLLLFRYNLVRGWWRYTGFRELMDVAKTIVFGTVIFFFLHQFIIRGAHYEKLSWPFSSYVTEALLTAGLLISARGSTRLLAAAAARRQNGKRVVLIGAGAGAVLIIKETERGDTGFDVVACVDDDERKLGIRIERVTVEGTVDEVAEIASRHKAEEIWIAAPSATPSQVQRFVSACRAAKLPFKTLPRLKDIVAGDYVRQIRNVDPVDLLPRKPISIDSAAIKAKVQGRVIMVTGAAGSIGSELCRQLLMHKPAMLICVDQNETGMFYLELQQRSLCAAVPVIYRVADICNTVRVQQILREFKVATIFHAAAYKHVPVMEGNVREAVYNNILSLRALLDCADQGGVQSFVMISSDKAVNPTNVMGTTKRVGELIISSRPASKMKCVAVRFGNVLGSNGSVVPVFQEQIRRGGEITITHPEIKRYFMTIDEAVSLVLEAFTIGQHGDILVLDMGEPVRILDMARNLIQLSGKSEDEVKIRFVGLREGEKLKEELFYDHEQITSTEKAKILRTQSRAVDWQELSEILDELSAVNDSASDQQLRSLLKKLVPEYSPQTGGSDNALSAAAPFGGYGVSRVQ